MHQPAPEANRMQPPHKDDERVDTDPHRSGFSAVPDEAPDAVETRDARIRPVPSTRTRAWMYAIPAALLLIIGIVWMLRVERSRPGGEAPFAVTGTSGERSNDPEGGGRGDHPLNPVPQGPSVIGDMELLSSKSDYVGRAVELAAVPVMTVPGPRTFWVGRIANRTLVLIDRDAQGAKTVKPGEIVRMSGRLEPAPSSAELARAGLTADDREAVEGEKVIIRATRVAPQEVSVGAHQSETPSADRQ